MKATVYRLIASNEENTEFLLNSYEMPTMQDVDVNEYRGYDIILHTYEVELSNDVIFVLSGNDEDELEYMTIEDMAQEIDANDLIDYIDSEGIDTASEDVLEELDRVNQKSDELINDVMYYLAAKLKRTHFKKYDFINGKSIRIANHTHNPMNGTCDINVVIAEQDQTRGIFRTASNDLFFNNNAKVEDIVESIFNF